MSKINVSTVSKGVFYLEIPNADLRIICGTPADCVKNLIQTGIIKTVVKNGVSFETGPNAVLLSDASIQNGQLSNLSEFPILQMLYRQGMIIPNHPNNNNKRPIIIGSVRQINAQMEYIYLGNYGINRMDELLEAGLSEREALELTRLKKKFAFGRFMPSKELMHSHEINGHFTEIINGVHIKRFAINNFELKYGDDRVTVDLNLKPGENYDTPYKLKHCHFKRNHFSIVHSGQGNGWDIHRPCMATTISYRGKIYLIDAIPNIDAVIKKLGIGINEIAGVFQSHVHDDHFNGITALLKTNHKLNIYTTPLIRRAFIKKLGGLIFLPENAVQHMFNFVDLIPEQWNDHDGLEIKPMFSPHPIETYNFFFRCLFEGGYKTYAHLADTTSFRVLDSFVEENPAKPGITKHFADKIKSNYLWPADVKKIDIGGGMIHGEASDFQSDASEKIIFAHTTEPITDKKLLVFGHNAEYGAVDTLIDGNINFLGETAKRLVNRYFEPMEADTLRSIANHPIVKLNPDTVLHCEKGTVDYVYLILTGIVSGRAEATGKTYHFDIGSLIGEESIYGNVVADVTHQTETYVDALKIPLSTMKEFVARHNLIEPMKYKSERRNILKISPLFRSYIPSYQLDRLSEAVKVESFSKKDFPGHDFNDYICKINERNNIFILLNGEVHVGIGNHLNMRILKKGDCFGVYIIYKLNPYFFYSLNGNCEIAIVNYDALRDIPCVFEGLHELCENATLQLASIINKEPYFTEYDFDKFFCVIQALNDVSQKFLYTYNYFEYEFHLHNAYILKNIIKNLLFLFDAYSKLKLYHFQRQKKDASGQIKHRLDDLGRMLNRLDTMLNEDKPLHHTDISEVKDAIVLSLTENATL